MAMTLVVMAAGRGSRFGGMKQVAGIGPSGEALLDYAVYDATRSGFDQVVFVVAGRIVHSCGVRDVGAAGVPPEVAAFLGGRSDDG